MRFTTKEIKKEKGSYLVEVVDSTGVKAKTDALVEYSDCSESGSGWRTFENVNGDWECHDEPCKTKKMAIHFLQKYGI